MGYEQAGATMNAIGASLVQGFAGEHLVADFVLRQGAEAVGGERRDDRSG